MTSFGTLISEARKAQNLSQSKLFFMSRVAPNRISEIETGKGCTLKTAFKLARALGIKNIPVE